MQGEEGGGERKGNKGGGDEDGAEEEGQTQMSRSPGFPRTLQYFESTNRHEALPPAHGPPLLYISGLLRFSSASKR